MISLAVLLLLAAFICFAIDAVISKKLVSIGLALWSAVELVGHVHIG